MRFAQVEVMKESEEVKLFLHADHDPAKNDVKDAMRLIEYLEHRNSILLLQEKEKRHDTFGDKLADKITTFGGSWAFILTFLCVLGLWVIINLIWLTGGWDPYPFILLNLCLSTLAALQAPIILMSQNRQASRDRLRADIDLERDRLDLEVDTFAAKVTRDAVVEIQEIKKELKEINKKLGKKR